MILTFKPQFVEPIKAGTKIHTIRTDKKGRWKTGMKIQFWCNNPRHILVSPYQFQSGICTDVKEIIIDFIHNDILIINSLKEKNTILSGISKLNEFACKDGFEDWESLKRWFFFEYGEKHFFGGKLIFFKLDGTR